MMVIERFNIPLLCLLLSTSSLASESVKWVTSDDLGGAIQVINAKATSLNYSLLPLSMDGFMSWWEDHRILNFQKVDRQLFDSYLYKGQLPPNYWFDLQKYEGFPARIILTTHPVNHGNYTTTFKRMVVDGDHLSTWESEYLPYLQKISSKQNETEFDGIPLPSNATMELPKNVPVRIQQIRLSLDSAQVDALQVDFLINRENITDLASYFGNAYSVEGTRKKLQTLLGEDVEKWISIRDILRGWPAKWVNRFPAEKTREEGRTANDVCHGVSRQFFMQELANGGLDRSTEATEYLLKTYYQLLPESAEPAFGDYLYLPGIHSIRFVLKDPISGRWIGFTSWSDEHTPYRLWWVDQEYRSPGVDVPRSVDFPRKMDLWRRKTAFHPEQ